MGQVDRTLSGRSLLTFAAGRSRERPPAAARTGQEQVRRLARAAGDRLIACVCALAISASAAHATAQTPFRPDYHARALALLNLIRFTDWPVSSFASDDAPYVLCVVGTESFGVFLSSTLAMHELNRRRFRVDGLMSGDPLDQCHVVFIPGSDGTNPAPLLARVSGKPVLTVSDAPGFGASGGMVTLFSEGRHVRFSINRLAVSRSGLRMSALLLGLSRTPPAASDEDRR